MNYELFTDELMKHYTSDIFKDEVIEAKKAFFGGNGPVDAEEPDYEMKIIHFSEWYLFTRPLKEYNVTPAVYAKEDDSFELNEQFPDIYKNLVNHRHSLFEFIKLSKTDLHIRDVISKYKFIIKDSPVTIGFNKGQVFEARVIPHGQSFSFMKSFCLHPPQATKFILKEVKVLQKNKDMDILASIETLIQKLNNKKQKYEQYKHVAVEMIYSNEPKI